MRLIEAGFGAYKKTAPRKDGSLALFFTGCGAILFLLWEVIPAFGAVWPLKTASEAECRYNGANHQRQKTEADKMRRTLKDSL